MQENRPPILNRILQQNTAGTIGAGHGGPSGYQGGVGSTLPSYQAQKYQDEIKSLKMLIDRLSTKLKEYQLQLHLPDSEFQNLFVANLESDMQSAPSSVEYSTMLSSHLLGPLFHEYEAQLKQYDRELKVKNLEVQRQAEEIRSLVRENEELGSRLEVQQREYLKVVEETRDNADLLVMRTGSLRAGGDQANNSSSVAQQQIGVDEVKELRERVHLLTEENQVLFEQITLLRSHYDKYNEECTQKLSEAQLKSESYDLLEAEFTKLTVQRDELLKANTYLEKKYTETAQILTIIEEERRQDQQELMKMKEQLTYFKTEYQQYKDIAERLQVNYNQDFESLAHQLRDMKEKEKDYLAKIAEIEDLNQQLQLQQRQAVVEIQRLDRDLRQVMQVNDGFQLQANEFQKREYQYQELSKEYREKLEQLKLEQERIAMKEQQFLRQVQKSESESKSALKRAQEKHDSMLHSRQRDFDRKVEELEDKLNRVQDECDEYRRKYERLEKINWDQRRQIEEHGKKEDKQSVHYERMIEQLKLEIREKERDKASVEVTLGYEKQDLSREISALKDQLHTLRQDLSSQAQTLDQKNQVLTRLKEENTLLKATVQETDKSREIMVREMGYMKDLENDRIKEIEKKKDAEIKMLEKVIEGMKRDKKDYEQRIEDLRDKLQLQKERGTQEYHQTVQYFQQEIDKYKMQVDKFHIQPSLNTNMQKIQKSLLKEAQEYAQKVIHALNESCTHFHAVNYCKQRLTENGFQEIREVDQWNLEGGKSYFFTRNNSTLVAFIIGAKAAQEGVSLFKIVGCHTDSPVLKLAPVTKMADRSGFNQVAVQLYGGGLWHTWFDRDLTLAGKVIVNDNGKLISKYWRCNEPILKVPNLAIHLTDRSGTFEPNKESHTKPILASSVVDQLFGEDIQALSEDKYRCDEKHFKTLLNRISSDLGIERNQIVDFELNVIDTQPAGLLGLHQEFVSSPRLDNLGSSLVSLDSIIDVYNSGSHKNNAEVSMIMLFDHEEVGSQSAQGADSNMAAEITHRVFESLALGGFKLSDYYRAIRQSFLISADMAHGVHPNYSEKHQPLHAPKIHQGIALKINANQRYMTDTVGSAILRTVAEQAGVPLQEFIVKNDSPCGSTIGPMMAAKAGIKTVDIGAPMLGMHSIRETCGVIDLVHYRKLFNSFFTNYSSIPTALLQE